MAEHDREAVNGDRPLEGRVALVTGASSGLGRATTIALARAGADVALVARSEEELESAKEEVSQTDRRALILPTDLANEDEAAGAVEGAVEAFGRIDVVVNAAGTDTPGTVEELDVEGWDRTLSVNLRAPFLLFKTAFPHMREAGGGTIVNISSVAGKKGWGAPRPTVPPSSASRASRGIGRRREGARHPGDRAVSSWSTLKRGR